MTYQEAWAEELRRMWAIATDEVCEAICRELEEQVSDVPTWEELEVYYR